MTESARTSPDAPTPSAPLSRRALLTASAWAAPAILLATAVPSAAASLTHATVTWGGLNTFVSPLYLLEGSSGGQRLRPNAFPMAHDAFTVTNSGASALTGLTASLTVQYGSNTINRDLKGWGIYAVDGSPTAVAGRTVTPRPVATGGGTTYDTTQTLILGDVPPNSSRASTLTFGLTAEGGIGQTNVVNYHLLLTIFDDSGNQIRPPIGGGLTAPQGLVSLG